MTHWRLCSREKQTFKYIFLSRRFGTKCAGCLQGISPNDLVRKARSKVFHLNCFTCMVCNKQLSTGEELYVIDENKFVCKEDYLGSGAIKEVSLNSGNQGANKPRHCVLFEKGKQKRKIVCRYLCKRTSGELNDNRPFSSWKKKRVLSVFAARGQHSVESVSQPCQMNGFNIYLHRTMAQCYCTPASAGDECVGLAVRAAPHPYEAEDGKLSSQPCCSHVFFTQTRSVLTSYRHLLIYISIKFIYVYGLFSCCRCFESSVRIWGIICATYNWRK